MTSAKKISVRAEWLHQSGRAPSEPSGTPRWQTTPRPAPIQCVALHIALRSPFCCFFISKKHFRLGGMAPSEWTRSVRAVRDTPVADYSAPGVNTTRRVAHRRPIAVSPFLTQTLQEHSQMLLKAPAVMEVHSGLYEI